ncbi:cAMP-binding protein [Arcticibacter svalbardensis MN12-7]|uniref:cAMP-binding protein n=1 Tax=Arcticibacter svalbardensis MN12-7 TaxID=1150600 RepID=R9GPM2_9SPHI|nr:Crp/Fnr family transcriptional regulator [Arcticibacter svalbardensis]EOR93641.1 cAMP-binding protein [Arcticibacter svalbardensis MN12-7]
MNGPDLIIENISHYIQLDEREKELFLSLLIPASISRKQIILQEGDICRYSTFVYEGCLRGYTYDKNGLEHVLNFAPKNWWIADMYSWISQKPGILNIEALADSKVLKLSKVNQDILYKEVPKFERFFRIIIEKSLVASQERVLNNLSLTAEERYTQFCAKYPSLIEHVPLKQVASYIGVTPEFFSKMRNGLLKKK